MRRAAAVLAVAGLLVAAGCSDGSDDAAGTITEQTTTTAKVPDERRDYVDAADAICREVIDERVGDDGISADPNDADEFRAFVEGVAAPALREMADRLRELDPPPEADVAAARVIVDDSEAAADQLLDEPQLAAQDPRALLLNDVTERARRFGLLVCPLG